MNQKTKNSLITVLFLLFLFVTVNAQTPLQFGNSYDIESKVLGETRTLLICTPRGYEQSQEKYPVIYMLDGMAHYIYAFGVESMLSRNRLMPQSIIVSITNTARNRDFTPTIEEGRQVGGGADNFLKFLEDEVFPFVEKKYRTQPYRTIYGHSLCGMFSLYSLVTKPELFDSYIAVSPYLMYDNEVVLNKMIKVLEKQPVFNKKIYVTLGHEPAYDNSLNKMTDLFKANLKPADWTLVRFPDDTHGSVPLKSFYGGLEFIYNSWRVPQEVIDEGVESIAGYFVKISKEYKYEIIPPENMINMLGYQFSNENKYEKAKEMFEYNIKLYPNSANVYDSYAELLEKLGENDEAAKNYKLAVERGEKNGDPNLNIYKTNFERVSSRD